ncbi:MAG: hypothetical protein QOF75_1906 [Gaiellaceae bacterium]|jgi:hypothetical protein|nr:hypothetical protein [Gaiellaceae bacterium]
MHGLIFTSFRRFTDAELRDVTEAVWRDAPRYGEDAAYNDGELVALVDRAAALAGTTRRDVLLRFGSFTAQHVFRELQPEFYAGSAGTRQFLLDVEQHIHRVLSHTIPGAAPPRLQVVPFGSGGLSITYTSDRGLCDLLEGLAVGTAAHYGESFEIDHPTCMHRGDDACAFFMTPVAGA